MLFIDLEVILLLQSWFRVFALAHRCSSQLPPLLLQPQLPHTEPEQASAAAPPQQPRPHHQGECQLCCMNPVIQFCRRFSLLVAAGVQHLPLRVVFLHPFKIKMWSHQMAFILMNCSLHYFSVYFEFSPKFGVFLCINKDDSITTWCRKRHRLMHEYHQNESMQC